MAQILRCGLRKNFAVISFLIVSTSELCEKISEGLLNCSSVKKNRILVHTCESVNEVISKYKNLHVDFVVFAFDSTLSRCLEEVEKNIFLIDQNFILHGLACLVRGNQISVNAMGVNIDKILEISDKYSLRLLNANVSIPEDCLYLGDRIISLASAVLGHKSGFLLLNTLFKRKEMSSVNDSVK